MEITEEEKKTAVVVKNCSLQATDTTLIDFFSFCGNIKRLHLEKDADGETQTGIVIFADLAGSETAQLLSNAVIIDKPVSITPYLSTIPAVDSALPASTLEQQEVSDAAAGEANPKIWESVVAGAKDIGSKTKQGFKEFDEKHNVSLKVKEGAESVKAKLNQVFDRDLHISEKFADIKEKASESSKKVGEKLHVKETAASVGASVGAAFKGLGEKVKEAEMLSKAKVGAKTVSGKFSSLVSEARSKLTRSNGSFTAEELPEVAENASTTTPSS